MGEDRIRDAGWDDRVTVADAAERLGITKEAVRKRISRKTLRSDKDPDGMVHVYIPSSRTPSGTASESIGRDALIELLRTQLEDLRADRDAWREQARRSDYMASAALDRTRELEGRLRELEAPAEAPVDTTDSPETAEEEPQRAEPHSAMGGAQEATERPQQRSGWLAQVDKLPWWHYVLGLLLVFLSGFLVFILTDTLQYSGLPIQIVGFVTIPFAQAWLTPGVFGFWVGFRRRYPMLVSQIIPFGALVGFTAMLGLLLRSGTSETGIAFSDLLSIEILATIAILLFLPGWLLYVSGALIGNAWQRRRTGRISGTTPASPVSRATQGAAQQPRKDLTPAQQAMLGWGGTIISALITLVGTIIAVRSGR